MAKDRCHFSVLFLLYRRMVTNDPSSYTHSAPLASPAFSNDELQAPGLMRRMACWLYEGLLMFALMMVAVLLQTALALLVPALNHPALLQTTSVLLWGLYFVWFWEHGQTLPMKTWRIAIVDAQGQRIHRLRALTRYAYSWIWCAPLLVHLLGWHLPLTELALWQSLWVLAWALLSRLHPLGQFWHDAWAGTRLISTPSAKARTQ